jgi:hypothetical protein
MDDQVRIRLRRAVIGAGAAGEIIVVGSIRAARWASDGIADLVVDAGDGDGDEKRGDQPARRKKAKG